MTTHPIDPDLKKALKRLKLGRMLDTLPERLTLSRQQRMPHQDFLLLILDDEISRRDSQAQQRRASKANLRPQMQFERWDETTTVTFDQAMLNELSSLRFITANHHLTIVGPVGVGKTFVAHALGHAACRRGFSVMANRTDKILKTLKHARLDNTYDIELRKLLTVDLLILDDFAHDAMEMTESRDTHEILIERHRSGSIIVTSNRSPDEWLATFADPIRAQSAIDRFTSNSYDLVMEGESYRSRQKPQLPAAATTG